MTVKELAQFTGKSETTVQRWVKNANCKMQLCNNKMQLQLSISEHKDIRKIPDERWGQVNSYSVSVLKELFEV